MISSNLKQKQPTPPGPLSMGKPKEREIPCPFLKMTMKPEAQWGNIEDLTRDRAAADENLKNFGLSASTRRALLNGPPPASVFQITV